MLENRAPLTFRGFFSLLENSGDFVDWYGATLANCGFEAFFWELPPLTSGSFDNEAEFVLIESSALAALRPEPAPFAAQFADQRGADVITFPNLGGDALLIVPTPAGSAEAYPHLASFLRHASGAQVTALWQAAARCVVESLGPAPRWLSTAGLGVSWLHLRLDTRPKYYRFKPYTKAP